jgi:predicted nucleic acid-binding protein
LSDLLLDTNAVSAVMTTQKEMGRFFERLDHEVRLHTCVTVEGEVRFGLERLPSAKKKRRLWVALTQVLERFHEIIPITREVASNYAVLKADLKGAGKSIDENDLWIAAVAVTHGLVLLSSDKGFQDIPGLAVDDWSAA